MALATDERMDPPATKRVRLSKQTSVLDDVCRRLAHVLQLEDTTSHDLLGAGCCTFNNTPSQWMMWLTRSRDQFSHLDVEKQCQAVDFQRIYLAPRTVL